MEYAFVDLTGPTVLSTGPLPESLMGLAAAELADLGAALSPCPPHLIGLGYWPVVRVRPWIDPDTEQRGRVDLVDIHAAHQSVIITTPAVPLSAEALAARLAAAREQALAEIDRQAEAERQHHLTPGAGQAMEYAAAEAEADRAIILTDPDPAAFPMLSAEQSAQIDAGINSAPTLLDIAAQVQAQAAAWRGIGAAIRRIRRAAKLRVSAAPTAAEVRGIIDTLVWEAV